MQIIAARQQNDPHHEFIRQDHFPFWTLVLIRKGWTPLKVGNEIISLKAPCLMLARPGAVYRIGSATHTRSWEESWVVFAPAARWEVWMQWPVILPGIMGLGPLDRDLAHELSCAFDDAQKANLSSLAIRHDLAMNHLERMLILAQSSNHQGTGTRLDVRIQAVIDHLNLHLHEPLSVRELAERVHMSESHLAHVFRHQVGVPPKRFIEVRRMHRAMDLLIATNRPIGRIASEVGFDNAFHFSSRFRRCVGCSPRMLRQNPAKRDECYAHLMNLCGLQKKK